MRILVVGPFGTAQRENAIVRGFRENGVQVEPCEYGDLLFSRDFATRLQFRLAAGPVLSLLTNRVIRAANDFRADVIFFRRPLEFTPWMIQRIRSRTAAVLASFNNDDPFSPSFRDRRWRSLRAAIPLFDVHFAFRRRNLAQLQTAGAKQVALWEPFFSPWLHRILEEPGPEREILYAMHWENDGRHLAVNALIEAGIPVRVHSWNWSRVAPGPPIEFHPLVWEDDYVRAVGRSLATICIFSSQNADELTSRVFEIPACGGILLAARNPRLDELFVDGEEAVFFSDVNELVRRTKELREDPALAHRIRSAGRRRLLNSRHSVVDRCADAISVFVNLIQFRTSPG